MATRKKYDAVVTIGTYKDKQTGEEKKRYATVGTVFENDEGKLSLKLDTIPVGPGWSGFIQFFEPRQQDGGQQRQQLPPGRQVSRGMPPAPPAQSADDGDHIPF